MPEEAGLAGLELVEIFLALRDDFRAMAVVEEVIAEFRRANFERTRGDRARLPAGHVVQPARA
jgi:hypothetical protein